MKKKIIYLIIIFAIIVVFWFTKTYNNPKIINNVPLNSFTIKFNSNGINHKFYFSRESQPKTFRKISENSITLKDLQPNSTYYYKIGNGKVHELNTVSKKDTLNGIIANSKNAIFVFDSNLKFLYKIKIDNLTDSIMYNGLLYTISDFDLNVYKDKKEIYSVKFNEKPRKFLVYKDALYLSTSDSIFKLNKDTYTAIFKSDFKFSDFAIYNEDFLLYKENEGVYYKNTLMLPTKYLSSFLVNGNYLFASTYSGNSYIVDLISKKVVYSKKFSYHIFTIYVNGNFFYLSGAGKLTILNIKDFSNVRYYKNINLSFAISKMEVKNNTLIGSAGNHGIIFMDLKTGKVINSFDNGIFAYDIAYLNGKYFITDPYEGIKVYDNNFNKIKTLSVKGFTSVLYSTGKYLVVGVDKELRIYDSNLNLISTLKLKNVPTKITGQYQYIFVSEHNKGFDIIDMENPKKPIMAEQILTSGTSRNLFFNKGTVYLANGSNVKAYNINMVINYEEKSTIKVNGDAFDCLVHNDILYIDNYKKSILMYDVSDLEKPRFIGLKKVDNPIVSMTFYKDFLICPSGFSGLYIYKDSGKSLKLYKKISDGSYYNKVLVKDNKIVVLKGESGFDILNSDFKTTTTKDWVFLYSVKSF